VSAAPLTKRDKRRMRTIAIVTFLVGGLVLVLAYLGYGMSL
jgi:predicted nucleic acid-binding Zn ribbon protein